MNSKSRSGTFNYDSKYRGASSRSVSKLKEDPEVNKDGFFINHSRVLVGSGKESFDKGKQALQNWKYVLLFSSSTDVKSRQ